MTEIDLTPITRLEYDIDAILNDHAVAEPITRIELILADIVAGNTTTVEPVTRIETYLAIISGADYPVPEPVTRIETFLAIIAGEDYEEPEAVTRLEGLLAEWVEKGSGIWKTVTGTLIHITDALASPVQALSIAIKPQQSGSGDPSPTNVRPITGWTGCNVNCGGANLYDHTYEKTGYLRANGDRKTSSSWAITYYIEVSTGNYVAKGLSGSGSGTYICVYDSEQTFLRSVEITANEPVYFSIANGEKYIRMSVRKDSSEYETAQLLKYDICPISWQTEAGTVYGGTLTVNEDGSVDLVADKALYDLSLCTSYQSSVNAWYAARSKFSPSYRNKASSASDFYGICDTYKIRSYSATIDNNYSVGVRADGTDRIYVRTDGTNSTAPAGHILLELAEPITYHLDSIEQISTLAGENNIWADVNGEITLTYLAEAE